MRDPSDLRTLETTELIPIDLNSLMYNAERTIAALRSFRKQPGDSAVAAQFNQNAERRRQSLLTAAYEPGDGYFYDVRWRTWERVTDRPTLAAASVLFFGLALPHQAVTVASRLEREFLKPGGFVTTNIALRAAVGLAQRLAAARVDGDRRRSPLWWRRPGEQGARSLAGAQSAHVSSDGTNDGEVRRRGSEPARRRRGVRLAGRIWLDERGRARAERRATSGTARASKHH